MESRTIIFLQIIFITNVKRLIFILKKNLMI